MSLEHKINTIWESFLIGKEEAFANIYSQHIDMLFRYGTKLCADEEIVKDGIQEVFVDLYLKRERNKINPEKLKYYLILSLKRNLIKKMKKNRTTGEKILSKELLFEPEYNIEQVIIKNEEEIQQRRRVEFLLKDLPIKQKEVIYLRFNESMEYSDIAKVMNISVESVRKQVYRAIKTVRELFLKENLFEKN